MCFNYCAKLIIGSELHNQMCDVSTDIVYIYSIKVLMSAYLLNSCGKPKSLYTCMVNLFSFLKVKIHVHIELPVYM